MDIQSLITGFLGSGGCNAASKAANALGGGGLGGGALGDAAKSLGSGLPGGLAGGAAAGALVATLVSSKKARKFGGKALTYGGLAVLGGLAYKAYRDHKSGAPQPSAPAPGQGPMELAQIPHAPAGSSFDPSASTDQSGANFQLTLIQAIISAAMADGHVNPDEHAVIHGQIGAAGLDAEAKAFLFDQLSKPSDPIAIASLTTGEEQAAEVYLASLVVLDDSVPADLSYKQRLGDALRLPADLRHRLEAHAEQALLAAT